MSDSREVPRIDLVGRHLSAPVRGYWSCGVCDFKAIAMSEQAVGEAMDAHARYVNTQLDRATDPHFADVRLDRLIQA